MSQKVSWTVKCLTGIDVKFIELLLYRGIRDNFSHPNNVGHHFADLKLYLTLSLSNIRFKILKFTFTSV